MQEPSELWQALGQRHPAAARLAVLSSIPIRVSPAFLRLARLRLLEEATTGNEADLWLSDLVEARSSGGFSFRYGVRRFLRERLASDPWLLDRVWRDLHLSQAHWLSPKARLEEELTWRLLRDPRDPRIQDAWRSVLDDMEQGVNAVGVARWVMRAIPDLPPGALESDAANKVWIGAHLLLGDTSILGDRPQRFVQTGEFAFATRRLPRRRIQVGMTPQGLIVSPSSRMENGHVIDVPSTRPLWIQIEDQGGEALEVLTLGLNRPAELAISEPRLVLRLIDGAAHRITDANYAAPGSGSGSHLPRVQIEYDVEVNEELRKIQLPFVMGVLADLSGNPQEPLAPVADRKLLEVDADNFFERLKSMKPRAAFRVSNTLTGEGNLSVDLSFDSMDDFSPAGVARKVEPLNKLLEARTLLSNLLTYMDGKTGAEELVAQLLRDPALMQAVASAPKSQDETADKKKEEEQETTQTETRVQGLTEGEVMEEDEFSVLLQKEFRPETDRAKDAVAGAVRTLAEHALSSSAVDSDEAIVTVESIIAEIDGKLSEQLNEILHHADFQQLESAWRGLHYLASNTETDEMLKIRVMNISKKELHTTLRKYKGTAWDQSPIFKKVYEEEYGQFGGEPFGCLVGDYYFDHSPPDVELLGEMAKVAAAAHAPFISAVAPSAMHMDSWQELSIPRDLTKIFMTPEYAPWRSLRESEDARYIALAMPRVLARLPYGAETHPVQELDFEEETAGGDSSKYTWANSAYAMAVNINRAFKLFGWCVRIQGVETGGMVEDLPVHTFPTDDGGVDMKCPTEIAISARREHELANNGFMPLVHRKNTDSAAFVSDRSLQKPFEYDEADATANAVLAARLSYLFACCRFVHYLKCIVRDKIGSFRDRQDMEHWLNQWIHQYVSRNPELMSEEDKARYPLAAGEVVVEDVEDGSGYSIARFYLRPHYQLGGLTASLRMVSRLPSTKF